MPEEPSHSIVDLGSFGEAAKTLINKVSKAVTGYCRPWQIRRVAQAESEAAIMRAKADAEVAIIGAETAIQITDVHRRAVRRFIEEEAQRQENMEGVILKALPQVKESANADSMDDDWITNFFDKCRIVSDSEMQQLWARILAGEANSPGAFSKSAVNLLSNLDKADAALFTNLCGFVWGIDVFEPVPLVIGSGGDIYRNAGIDRRKMHDLESIGLVKTRETSTEYTLQVPETLVVRYFGRGLRLAVRPLVYSKKLPEREMPRVFGLGVLLFTKVGRELAPICGSKPVEGFWEYMIDKWRRYDPKPELDVANPRPANDVRESPSSDNLG